MSLQRCLVTRSTVGAVQYVAASGLCADDTASRWRCRSMTKHYKHCARQRWAPKCCISAWGSQNDVYCPRACATIRLFHTPSLSMYICMYHRAVCAYNPWLRGWLSFAPWFAARLLPASTVYCSMPIHAQCNGSTGIVSGAWCVSPPSQAPHPAPGLHPHAQP